MEKTTLALLFLSIAITSPVRANFIQPGNVPVPKPGPKPAPPNYTETYSFTPSGGGKPVNFTITVTPGEANTDKAQAIVDAIGALPGGAASLDSNIKHPEEVNAGGTIALVSSTSGEVDSIFALGPALPGSLIALGFDGTPTGTTPGGGAVSMFSVSLGYDGLLAQSSLAFSNLVVPTVEGVVLATFQNLLAGLPGGLQGDLSLNLTTDTIQFNLPAGASNPFVSGSSTDQGVSYSETVVSATPEPSGMALAGLGALCLVAGWRRSLSGPRQ